MLTLAGWYYLIKEVNMSTKQYIGARYVPKFVGTYDPTQAYDALDVVDNGSGTTYIARIQTPPGTPLTDTTHWLVYGSSSGAILDLQGRVTTLENDDTTIKASILSIGGQVTTNTSDISALDVRVTADRTDINTLKNRTGNSDRRIILMADSYGDYTTGSWTDYCETRLKAIYGNDNVYNITMGSRGFAYNPAVGTFEQGLAGALSSILHPETITDIYVFAGTNDAEGIRLAAISASDLDTAITSFVAYARSTFINALVHIGCIGTLYNSYASLRTARGCYKKCVNYGAEYVEKSECILDDSFYTDASGLHPTTAGFAILNPKLLNAILGGEIEVINSIPASSRTYALYSTVSSITTDPLNIRQYNHTYDFTPIGGNVVTFSSSRDLSSNVNIDIATYDDFKFIRGAGTTDLGQVPISLTFSNGATALAWMALSVIDKKIRLTFDPKKWVTTSGTVPVNTANAPTNPVTSLTFTQDTVNVMMIPST